MSRMTRTVLREHCGVKRNELNKKKQGTKRSVRAAQVTTLLMDRSAIRTSFFVLGLVLFPPHATRVVVEVEQLLCCNVVT